MEKELTQQKVLDNVIRDDEYKRLSEMAYDEELRAKKQTFVYADDPHPKPWKIIDEDKYVQHDEKSGFDAVIIKKGDNIVVAFRGTQGGEIIGAGWPDAKTDVKYIIGKSKVDKFDLDIGINDGKLDIDFHQQNQFRQAYRLVQKVKEKYPNYKISTTGHSLGGALASYTAGMFNLEAVTYNSPSVIDLLPEDLQKKSINGDFDKTIVNYVNPKDSISSGALHEYDRHIGSTYYIGSTYQVENSDRPLPIRLFESIIDQNYHSMSHYTFDEYGNISNPMLINAQSGEALYQSPRYYSNLFATIEITPHHLKDASRDLHIIRQDVHDICTHMKSIASSLNEIHVAVGVRDDVIHTTENLKIWFDINTDTLIKTLNTKADAFARVDGFNAG